MKLLLVGAALLAALISFPLKAQTDAQVGASSRGIGPGRVATITADVSVSGITIPSDFVGFDFEQWDLVTLGVFAPTNTSLINLMKLIGSSGSISFTGASGDLATPPALTSGIANNLASFASSLGAGWKLYYALDAFCNCSATAASQASLLATAFGVDNVTFAIGTEETESGNFTNTTYQTRWNAYKPIIDASVSGAKYGCCDLGNFGNTQSVLSGITGAPGNLSLLTNHYFGFGPYPANQSWSSALMGKVIPDAYNLFFFNINYTIANSLKYRVTQTNSVAGGGQPGLSNMAVSSAWFIDYAIVLARMGFSGVNLHGGVPSSQGGYTSSGNFSYSPLVLQLNGVDWGPGPVFYGQYLFSKIQGQHIVPSSIGGNANVNAIATLGGGSNANILVANLDVNSSASVTPAQSSAWTTANVLKISAPGGCLSTSIQVGGASIGNGGSWSGTSFPIANGQSVSLGPCEAALISIQP